MSHLKETGYLDMDGGKGMTTGFHALTFKPCFLNDEEHNRDGV